ncbi:MAG: secondary thiamine-phosphate synthase enzyme YjbQ [Actinomycetes bacterium]|nr:secondary thiamine-phosphate synthase enzyme YjbQ [Actinomycetes bacterium]
MRFDHSLKTPREDCIDITAQVRQDLRDSGVDSGIVVVYCPHTTAAITINENADPDVVRDLLVGLDAAFPDRSDFRHAEGNSAAHLKAGAVGSSVTVIIERGRLLLGIWQGIYFCEFDGPRDRDFHVQIIRS